MLIRKMVERSTHRLVIKRRMPNPFGDVRFLASSEGGLKYLRPSLEAADPTLLGLADELTRPGDIVWDIGANMGLFSFAAARRAGAGGRVIAVDADTYNVSLLRRSAAMQSDRSAPVDVVPTAISDQIGLATFQIARRNRATNALMGYGTSQMGGVRQTQTVPTLTLDQLLDHFPPPDILKIDVEGAEMLVLRGGAQVLDSRPTIVCEVNEPNVESVASLLRPLGYAFYDGDVRAPRPEIDRPPFTLLAMAR